MHIVAEVAAVLLEPLRQPDPEGHGADLDLTLHEPHVESVLRDDPPGGIGGTSLGEDKLQIPVDQATRVMESERRVS